MLSIVIPVYNVLPYIDECLRSVLAQTFSDFEVLLINDGSTDGSDRKCLEWAQVDARIRYMTQTNCGLGATRNRGLAAAKGAYVTFLDSDDWWDATYVEKMLSPAYKYNADIIVCNINYVTERPEGGYDCHLSELRLPHNQVFSVADEPDILNRIRTFACGKVYKRTFLEKCSVPQPSHAFEDIPFTSILSVLANRVFHVDQPLYNYRRNRVGSLANNSAKYQDILLSLEALRSIFVQRRLFDKYIAQLSRLMYGQVRFILQKIESSDKPLENRLIRYLQMVFPDVAALTQLHYVVIGGKLARQGVKNLVLSENRQMDCWNSFEDMTTFSAITSDIIIVDGLSLPKEKQRIIIERHKENLIFLLAQPNDNDIFCPRKNPWVKRIEIDGNRADEKDEVVSWDIADTLFYALRAVLP